MAAGKQDAHDAPMAEINVTPLVDVMLVLLVIFIVLAPLFAQALKVELPKTDAPPVGDAKLMDVEVGANGAITVDAQPIPPGGLADAIRAGLAREPTSLIRLGADKTVPYEHVAQAISSIQAAGAKKIAFATSPRPRAKP